MISKPLPFSIASKLGFVSLVPSSAEATLTVELPTAVRVIFPLEESRDKDVLLGTLRLIYSQVTDRQIDLRFKNALLR